jgi:hypothetical protein
MVLGWWRPRDGAALRARPSLRDQPHGSPVHEIVAHPLRTVAIGMVGVGMTSVGSGSLTIILLLFLYPTLGAKQLVGQT